GLLAGRPHEPTKRTSIHHRHVEAGAKMMWTGVWRRPHSYGDPAHEAQAVHDGLGVIDVSTLGKLIVEGPDAAELLERLYPNRFADLKEGRIRYAVLGTDAGRIMDDGTVARLSDDSFYVTTTSTGADTVIEWFEWWNAVWGLDVEISNVTGALAAVNIAGTPSREQLVGFEMANGVVPPEGGQIVVGGRPGGRVTSSRWSEELGGVIGMAWVPPSLAEDGTPIDIKVDGHLEQARVRLKPFFDPEGERLRS